MSSPTTRVDRETFLDRLRRSGLIPVEQWPYVESLVPDADRGKVLARLLVEQGILTRFQAERLLAGRTEGFILGQYRILDELGRGGMGRVFKAQHMTMNRIVALKVLNPKLTETERARQLFLREVKAAAKLSHPNIVAAFDANQIGDRCYLVLEYVDGPNLHEFVKEKGVLPVSQACEFIRQVAVGLQYAHDLGMVHRDIKPANMLVQKPMGRSNVQTVKILDFGLARINAPEAGEYKGQDSILAAKSSIMGTPDFLPPEQARDLHAVDGRSDIYSLGCSLYYLLTKQVPFPGGTQIEKLMRHATEEPIPVEQLRPEVPTGVAAIVRKMMAKKQADRFQNAQEVALALTPWCVSTGSGAWKPIELPPMVQVLPHSGVYRTHPVPGLVAPPMVQPLPIEETVSPWSNLLDEEESLTPTHGIHNEATQSPHVVPPATATSFKLRRQTQRRHSWFWSLLFFLVSVLVVGATIAALWWMVHSR